MKQVKAENSDFGCFTFGIFFRISGDVLMSEVFAGFIPRLIATTAFYAYKIQV